MSDLRRRRRRSDAAVVQVWTEDIPVTLLLRRSKRRQWTFLISNRHMLFIAPLVLFWLLPESRWVYVLRTPYVIHVDH